jgi:hypothetical protein
MEWGRGCVDKIRGGAEMSKAQSRELREIKVETGEVVTETAP